MAKVEITEQDVLDCVSSLEWRTGTQIRVVLENRMRIRHRKDVAEEIGDAPVYLRLQQLKDNGLIKDRSNKDRGPKGNVEYLKSSGSRARPKVSPPKLRALEPVYA